MIIVVCGATASYKTRLSVDLAKKYNGIVVNADSLQVYKELDIATAKIKEEEKRHQTFYESRHKKKLRKLFVKIFEKML